MMQAAMTETTHALRAEGPRRFARWDEDLFLAILGKGRWMFRHRYRNKPHGPAVFRAWARLVQEAVGRGQIAGLAADKLDAQLSGHSLQGFLLGDLALRALSPMPPAAQVPALALAWNLLEGLEASQPAWVVRYALNCMREDLEAMSDLEEFLALVLESVMTSRAPSRFKGPFSVTVIDTRGAIDDLLPGEIYPAAPGVLCVADRRDPGQCTALFLRRGGASSLMGRVPRLPAFEDRAVSGIEILPGAARVKGTDVALPRLAHPHTHAVASAGFVVVSALDSQRLWVVESA